MIVSNTRELAEMTILFTKKNSPLQTRTRSGLSPMVLDHRTMAIGDVALGEDDYLDFGAGEDEVSWRKDENEEKVRCC